MLYFSVAALAVIGPFFWPLNNGLVFAAALALGQANTYGLALALAFGSTWSFLLFYLLGRSSRWIFPKWKKKMGGVKLNRYRGSVSALIFLGGACSLPPLTPVALLLGSTRFSVPRFLLWTFLGRCTRFLATAWMMERMVHIFQRSQYFDTVQNWLL